MKPIHVALMLALLVVPAEAKKNGMNKAARKAAQKEEKQDQKEQEEREKKHKAVEEVMKRKDANNDGSLTLEEYLSDESNKEAATRKFDQFNKNGDRALSRSELQELLGL